MNELTLRENLTPPLPVEADHVRPTTTPSLPGGVVAVHCH
jgi:hypothetical protein